ncbi:MAG: hypothetical protein II871_05040 [Clostridia bacterium]|nr:hypothetical protein [Clostridia bacterium]
MNNGYGFDRLSRDALIASTILSCVGVILWRSVLGMVFCAVATLLMALILVRTLSPNIERRQDELIGYESFAGAVSGFFIGIYNKLFKKNAAYTGGGTKQAKDPSYKYFKCPKCGREYRAPKGKGKIRVTCRECGEQFEKKI